VFNLFKVPARKFLYESDFNCACACTVGIISEENTKPLSAEAARAVDREHSKDFVLSPSKISPLVQYSTSSAKVGKDVDVPAEIPRKLEVNCDLAQSSMIVQFVQRF
jgi:hypothetical protein